MKLLLVIKMGDYMRNTMCSFEIHPSFEEMGLRIDNLSLIGDGYFYRIYGDIFVEKSYYKSIKLNATLYDVENHVIYTSYETINLDKIIDFSSFEIFGSSEFYNDTHKVRIYPTVEKKTRKAKELKKKIVRLSQFEDKLGVNFKKLSVKIEGNTIELLGEIFIENEDDLDGIAVKTTIYDDEEFIIGSGETIIDLRTFFGFDTFSITIDSINPDDIDKITLYPVGIKK